MALIFLHHVVGDLTVGKPDLVEFPESEPIDSAVKAIANSSEAAIAVWRGREKGEEARTSSPAARFVGVLTSLDVVAFLARVGGDHQAAMRTAVSEVVVPNPGLLREVDPGTRLIDALEIMKQGVRRLLVRKSVAWKGMSKRFSIMYNGKWLRNTETSSAGTIINSGQPSSSALPDDKFCCLSREDVIRFLICCLGALAPIPLSSISSLGAITLNYSHIEASSPALEALLRVPDDPRAIAVVETNPDGSHKIIGDISAYQLWKCDYLAAAWAMANISAGQFVIGSDENGTTPVSPSDFTISSTMEEFGVGASPRPRKFSSRSIGFFSNLASQISVGQLRSMYLGRSAPLTCKHTSSLAAVMAQLLSHRATHVWVTDANSEDGILLGVIGFSGILNAVTKNVIPRTI
ncbi:CBS domain-containing protein CBSX6-like [Typha angustifolia]|uniref:CBS domain-containing protein CBSX6-like n=1 Tax=Typha angustifolia TaxID=59011 RepID=UPI003C2EFE4B